MKTAQIVTIKPQDGVIEYQIVEGEVLHSHGHQLTIELTAEQTGLDTSECPRLGSNLGEEPEGQRWDEEDLRKLFPRLWKEFGW